MSAARFLLLALAAPLIVSGCAGGDEVDDSTGGDGGYAGQSFGGQSGVGGSAFGGNAGSGAVSSGGGSGGAAGAGGVAGTGGAGGSGGGPTNDCCTPSSSPGCSGTKLQACVCAKEPYCCDTSWHPMCVVSVNTYGCGTCAVPGSGGSSSGGGGSSGTGGSGGGATGGTGGSGNGGTGGTPQCTGAKAFECGSADYQCSSSKCVKCATGLKNCNGIYSCECGGTCSGSTCSTCTDPGPEPNDTTLAAKSACPTTVCTINDCDASGSSVAGVIKSGGDVDFFKLTGTDGFCVVGPAVSTKTTGIQACVFASCNDKSDGFKSCVLGTPATEGTLKGCCTSTAGTAEILLDCASADDSALVYLRVKGNTTTSCVPYEVSYHF